MGDARKDSLKLRPYFESTEEEESILSAGADYAAGLRGGDEGVHFNLKARTVEPVLLARAQLRVMLELEGLICVESLGLDDDVIDAAKRDGQLPSVTVRELIERALSPEQLRGHADPLTALAGLRALLSAAVGQVDAAIERVKASPAKPSLGAFAQGRPMSAPPDDGSPT